jgi:hypothetical protein
MRPILAGLPALASCVVFISAAQAEDAVYVAKLNPLNSSVTSNDAKGTATFTVKGNELTIAVDAQGTPGGVMHLQHFHGFADGKAASCPGSDADKNNDGVIDLIETEPMAGTTMVPFHDDPVSMEIPRDTYPTASQTGAYHYEKTVSLPDLQAAFSKAFGGQTLDLDKRVVFLHGVVTDAKLPKTAASLGDIPATITLPIACGEIKRHE